MSHHIQVIIGKEAIIDELKNRWVHAYKLSLKQGFALIPLKTELLEDITELVNNQGENQYTEFEYLNASLDELLMSESHRRQLAYLETDYFGGVGTQSAILYKNQAIGLGPLKTEIRWNSELMSCEILPEGKQAINQVLERIGVRQVGEKDEFDSIELGFCRSNQKIIKKCL